MHYGWPADFEHLMKIAEELDLLLEVDDEDPVDDSDDEDPVDDSDDEDPVDDPDDSPKGIQSVTTPTFIQVRTISNLLREAGDELPPSVRQRVRLRKAVNERSGVVVSIYTNYDLATPVSDEFVEGLQIFLEEKERPRWYLDDELCYWRPRQKSSLS
ncbi:hypothetical protein B0H21DRAFT_306968 [Amylocystis lapponica]|nr:hypothetical protein B0H21DRAFT_306968 [Amylocystis lapponica]